MTKIWVFGDSFTFGDGCRPDRGIIKGDLEYYNHYNNGDFDIWPNLLSKMTGFEIVNLSKSGASNDYILDSIMSSINLIEYDDMVIISKTFFERFDIPTETGFDTIYAESLYGIEVCLESEKSEKNKIEKETILNYGLLYASHKLMKQRQDNRFNFLKSLLSNKVSKFYMWDVDSDFRKSFNTISHHSNGKYNDYHFSFIGHQEFANTMYKIFLLEKTLI